MFFMVLDNYHIMIFFLKLIAVCPMKAKSLVWLIEEVVRLKAQFPGFGQQNSKKFPTR